MAETPRFFKDPDSVLDYSVDWTTWLNGDSIANSSWIAPSGITVDSDNHNGSVATAWLSGGTEGASYTVVNRIDTALGRQHDQTIIFVVQEN